MTYHYTDPDGDRLHVTPTTRHGQPAINVRTARNDSKSSAAVDIPIDQLEDVVDGLRAVRREAVGAHPGIRPLQPEEQGTSVDWQAIARDRERELKTAGEARQRAETAIARVRAVVGELAATNAAGALGDGHEDAAARIRAALDEPSAPAVTDTAELEKTARVFAALHQSAEQHVSRVIALYEQWVKAGPPPLGTSVSRWWDARLTELRTAIDRWSNTT